jgi:hypothetical protein
MNLLILVNLGPGFPRYFYSLGAALRKLGHRVLFALDSPMVMYEQPAYREDPDVYLFTEFRKKHLHRKEIPSEFNDAHLWQLLFPDIDRFGAFGLNAGVRIDWYEGLASALLNFFSGLIESHRIEHIIYEPVSNSFAFAAYLAGQKRGVPYLGIAASRLPNRFELQRNPWGIGDELEQTYNRLARGDLIPPAHIEEAVTAYLEGFATAVPDYMRTNALDRLDIVGKYLRREKLAVVLRRIRYLVRHTRQDHPYTMGNPLLFGANQVRRSLQRKLRSPAIRRLYSTPATSDEYYLYPLQFHPEASTSVLARHYVDEGATIRNIAFNLPFGALLYVKDHISAHANARRSFYAELAALPNVKLIAPELDAKALALRSRGVITLTSTVGYEALVLGVPVFVLGRVFYDFHPLCGRVRTWDELFISLHRAHG